MGLELPAGERRKRLYKSSAGVGVCRAVVARVPTGVHGELHQVGKTANLLCAGSVAARQRPELVEVHGGFPPQSEPGGQELRVALFVEVVTGSVLRAVGIEVHEGRLIAIHRCERRIFHGRKEPQDRRIALAQPGAIRRRETRCSESGTSRPQPPRRKRTLQE
jgi:hypothetical protein